MIHIIGENKIREAQAFNHVRDSLEFDCDIYLGTMWANPLGIELKHVAIYNMEYLHEKSPLWNIEYMDTLANNHVVDYSKHNIEFLKKHGIDAFYMPYGYHKSLERTVESEKDIDVLFIGSTHFQRRIDILDKLSKHCNVVIAQGCYGDELDTIVSRAKVHLNMHHADGQALEVVRLNYLMANHGNIVSEFGNDNEMNEQYANGLRFADYESLVDKCLDALENPIDGYETIKLIPQDCKPANEWLKGKL